MGESNPLQFERNGSWARAMSAGIIIRPRSRASQEVQLTDTDSGHETVLVRLPNDECYVGRCDCLGFQHHSGACAHLWAVRIANGHNAIDIPTRGDLLEADEACPHCGRCYEMDEIRGADG